MVDRARGGESECSGLERLAGQLTHRGDLFGCGHFGVIAAAVAHDVDPQCRVGHLGPDIDGVRDGLDGVEVLGKRLPCEVNALGQGGARDVFDPFHHADQELMSVGSNGSESDTAVAHHNRRDAMPRRRGDGGIPQHLTVVVCVNIHKARRDHLARGIDFLAALVGNIADDGDAISVDSHVGCSGRDARSVDNPAVTNN